MVLNKVVLSLVEKKRRLGKAPGLMAKSTSTPPIETLPERVKDIRTKAGITQAGLAAAAGIDRANIVNIERRRRTNVRLHVLERIAIALGVDVLDLISVRPVRRSRPVEQPAAARLRENLRRHRKMAKVSQEALSIGIGRFRTYVGALETKTCKPTLDDIQRMADFLGTDVAHLLAPVADPEGQLEND